MNTRLALITILACPTVAASWMLLPRYYGNFFGPSLLDTMLLTPAPSTSTMIPKTSNSISLWDQLLEESVQMQQRMSKLPPSYSYQNNDHNITIHTILPTTMTMENVQVQYDDTQQQLWIRGVHHHEDNEKSSDVNNNSNQAATTTTTPASTKKMSSHSEFTQTFALDPNIVNVEKLTATYTDDHVLTVVVPKYKLEEQNSPKLTLRNIPITTTTTATTATNDHTGTSVNHNINNETASTTSVEHQEPVVTH